MNLLTPFLADAAADPDRVAIIDGQGQSITFGTLARRSAGLAAAWTKSGLTKGDRVLVAMPVGIDLYVALAALWRIGAVTVFPEPALGLAGVRHAARVTAPRAFLSGGWYKILRWMVPELRRVEMRLSVAQAPSSDNDLMVPVDAGHPALISFTSGSTGAPKGIVRSHGFLAAQNASVASLLRPPPGGAVDLVAFPVFVVANLGLGVTSVLPNWNVRRHDRADPIQITRHIEAHGVTRALLPPSVVEVLSRAPHPPRLQAIFTGGGPIFPDLMQRLAERMPTTRVIAVYGSTEAEPIAHLEVNALTAEERMAMREGAGLLAGRPVPEIAIRIEDGEILVAGAHVNEGYLDPSQDRSTKVRDGARIWHRTCDAGRIDAEGRLWLLGRHEARVGTLYPFAVEVAARTWPGVRQAALVGDGNRPLLAIEGHSAHREDWQRLAAHMGPIEVRVVPAIPLDRRHRSKIDYAALRAELRLS